MLQVEHLFDGVVDSLHEDGWETGHRALNEPPIVDRSELIDQQISVPPRAVGCGPPRRSGSALSTRLVVRGTISVEG